MQVEETDVAVVGYGGAGAVAAIAAHDAGARVTILEKTGRGGGNTRLASGSIREYLDVEKAAAYFYGISLGTIDLAISRTFVAESARNLEWLKSIGGTLDNWRKTKFPLSPHVVWPHIPGAEGIGGRWYVKGPAALGGANIWSLLDDNVQKRKIRILWNTSARELQKNREGISGVIADGPDGQTRVRSRRGVVLACGGFEFNSRMQLDYLGMKFEALGTPANTGDGVRMAQAVGADLWHMTSVSCGIGYRVPEYEIPFQHGMRNGAYIYVDRHGHRFVDEAGTDVHAMAFAFCHLDHKSLTYPRIPSHVIFDETARQGGPIIRGPGWVNDYYQWSEDNLAEVARGWIHKAGTIRELAFQVGLEPEALQRTVSDYNLCCRGSYDPDFERRQETLTPVEKPPFYAISVVPALLNTQGGPRRNGQARVLDTSGRPIRRLYSAGELGSIWGVVYPGAGNIGECLAFGRIAGRNAAGEKPLG